MNRRSSDRRYIKEAQREIHQARREIEQTEQGREQEKREKANVVQQEKDRLKGVLDQSSLRNRTLLIVFVTFMVYLTVTVLSTTDLDLFLPESKIDLPLIQLKIPLVAFFLVAPILLLVLHFNLLFNLYLHADKLKAWKQDRDFNPNNHLLPFIFNFLEVLPSRIIRPLLRFFIWSIAYAWPLVNLLLIQIRFSAYQHESMTAFHMGFVALDLIFLGAFWFRLKPSKKTPTENDAPRRLIKWSAVRKWSFEISFFILVMFFTGVNGAAWHQVRQGEELVSSTTLPSWWTPLIKPHLDLSNQTLLKEKPPVAVVELFRKEMSEKAEDKKTDPKIDAWMAHAEGLILKNRHFNFGNFRSSILLKANFQYSFLKGADLRDAQLQGAFLFQAQLQGAYLIQAQLQGADLRDAQFQGAYLIQAQLQGADLRYAQLQGADLRDAQFQGADLRDAQLQGADLFEAQFQGANLRKAQFQGANLRKAQLRGADLRDAQLYGTQWGDSEMVPLWLEEPLNRDPYEEWEKLLQMSVPKKQFLLGGIFSRNIEAGLKRTNDEEGLKRLREAHNPDAVKALWKSMACDENENEYVRRAMRERLDRYEIDWSCSDGEKEP